MSAHRHTAWFARNPVHRLERRLEGRGCAALRHSCAGEEAARSSRVSRRAARLPAARHGRDDPVIGLSRSGKLRAAPPALELGDRRSCQACGPLSPKPDRRIRSSQDDTGSGSGLVWLFPIASAPAPITNRQQIVSGSNDPRYTGCVHCAAYSSFNSARRSAMLASIEAVPAAQTQRYAKCVENSKRIRFDI